MSIRVPSRSGRSRSLALLACLVLAVGGVQGATLTLDPDATAIHFTLGATFHEVEGSLKLSSGAIEFDPASGSARGTIVLDALSAETGNPKRDRKMHENVLETPAYPDWLFRASRMEGTFQPEGESHLKLEGTLRIHGSDHPVEIPAVVSAHNGALQGEASLEIPYVAWGMKDPSVFVLRVDKVVQVTLHLEGRLTTGEGEAAMAAGGDSR